MFPANVVPVRLGDRTNRHLPDLRAAAHDDDAFAVDGLQRLYEIAESIIDVESAVREHVRLQLFDRCVGLQEVGQIRFVVDRFGVAEHRRRDLPIHLRGVELLELLVQRVEERLSIGGLRRHRAVGHDDVGLSHDEVHREGSRVGVHCRREDAHRVCVQLRGDLAIE